MRDFIIFVLALMFAFGFIMLAAPAHAAPQLEDKTIPQEKTPAYGYSGLPHVVAPVPRDPAWPSNFIVDALIYPLGDFRCGKNVVYDLSLVARDDGKCYSGQAGEGYCLGTVKCVTQSKLKLKLKLLKR